MKLSEISQVSSLECWLEDLVPDIFKIPAVTDLPGMVWHFLDGHGGGLSLLAAMKIAQGEVREGIC